MHFPRSFFTAVGPRVTSFSSFSKNSLVPLVDPFTPQAFCFLVCVFFFFFFFRRNPALAGALILVAAPGSFSYPGALVVSCLPFRFPSSHVPARCCSLPWVCLNLFRLCLTFYPLFSAMTIRCCHLLLVQLPAVRHVFFFSLYLVLGFRSFLVNFSFFSFRGLRNRWHLRPLVCGRHSAVSFLGFSFPLSDPICGFVGQSAGVLAVPPPCSQTWFWSHSPRLCLRPSILMIRVLPMCCLSASIPSVRF